MQLPPSQLRVMLAQRPTGIPQEGKDLVFEAGAAMPTVKDDHVLVRNLYMSLDPAMRPQMSIRTYVDPVPLGGTMRALTVGEVVRSIGQFSSGDLVIGPGGWQEYYSARPRELQLVAVPEGVPVNAALGILGGTGLTAYFGLLKVGMPKEGETVLVSGAAGATGNVVCQIAKKIVGCRVVGIAGGPEKCRFLINELGLDGAIDYKNEADLNAAIRKECPKGVDVYFDNVGGDQLNQALRRMRTFGRIILCGAISGYNKLGTGEAVGPGIPSEYVASMVSSRIRMQGFIVTDFLNEVPSAISELTNWLQTGKIKNTETVVDGLANAGKAFRGLFEGSNTGKLTVKIAEPSVRSRL